MFNELLFMTDLTRNDAWPPEAVALVIRCFVLLLQAYSINPRFISDFLVTCVDVFPISAHGVEPTVSG